MGLPNSVKPFARAAIAAASARLPHGACIAIAEGLGRTDQRWESLQTLARSVGVTDVRVAGELGIFLGCVDDKSVLGGYATRRTWAPQQLRAIEAVFNPAGGTFLDIGANIGLLTVPVAQNPRVHCVAFEPEPRNFGYLESNLASNCPHASVALWQVALFDEPGRLQFELSPENLGDHRVRGTAAADDTFPEGGRRTIEVEAARLDDVVDVATLRRPIVVKIDTQGAEPRIISGGANTIGAAELLVMEYWPYGIRRLGDRLQPMLEWLTRSFDSGSVSAGDSETAPVWLRMQAIASRMDELWNPANGTEYWDLMLRKQLPEEVARG